MQAKFKIGDKVKVHHYNYGVDMRWPKSAIGEVFTISDIVEDEGSFCVSGESSYNYNESELELVEAFKEPKKQKENTNSVSEFTQTELQIMQEVFKPLIKHLQDIKDCDKEECVYWWNYCIKDSAAGKHAFSRLNESKKDLKNITKRLKILSEIQRKIKKLK